MRTVLPIFNFNGSLIFFYCNNHFESLYPVNSVIMYFSLHSYYDMFLWRLVNTLVALQTLSKKTG